jgi:hypothetical protein
MSMLPDKEVVAIAKQVATSNLVEFTDVLTAPATDSTGAAAIEIKFLLTPGSSAAIMGERSATTVSQVIQRLSDAGEERFPIVRYEEQVAARP